MTRIDQLKTFFQRPGINKSGILQEAEIQTRLMNYVLAGKLNLTQKTWDKIKPVMERYGEIIENNP